MKVRRILSGAVGVMGLAAIMVFGAAASSSAHSAKAAAAAACKASHRHRGAVRNRPGDAARPRAAPLRGARGGPGQQGQRHPRHARQGRHGSEPVARGDEDQLDHRLQARSPPSAPRAARRSRPSVRCMAKAGMAFVSGSATLPALATSGANKTFFRVVPNDDIQGPNDANYIIKHKLAPAGSTILIVDDEEAYSRGPRRRS